MKKTVFYRVNSVFIALFILSSLFFLSCSNEAEDSDTTGYSGKEFTLDYEFGTFTGLRNNIYVIWLENISENFYFPVYICTKLLETDENGDPVLTGTVLPYWNVNKRSKMDSDEIDAVTGATKAKKDFSVSFSLPERSPDQFTVYFETDVSNYNGDNSNDWFDDQPAILYKADIDLDDIQASYTLDYIGWTPNETAVSNEASDGKIAEIELVLGGFQNGTRYITNYKDTSISAYDAFLDADDNPQTNLVGSITITPQ